MGASVSKERRLYRPFNAGEFTVAWLTFKGDAVEDEEQRSVAKKGGLLSSKLLRGLFGDMTMQCFEKVPGNTIFKEAFVCILALFYEGNTEDRISYIFTMYKIILSGENKKGEGFIAEKDYLYLLNYLEEYMPLPKQLYAAFEECLIPMAGLMTNSQFISWVRRYPDVMEFLAIHLPPSPLQGSPTSAIRAMNSEEFLANSDLLNNSPSCQNDSNRNSLFDFIGGEDSGDEDSDGVYDSDNLTEVEMSQSSYRENSTMGNGNDELSSILKEVGAVVKDDNTERTLAGSQSRHRTDSAPLLSSARSPHDSTASSRRGLNRTGVSRTRGVQKMGRYMGKAVGGGISRVGHVGRSILHVGKSQGNNKQQTGDHQYDDPAANDLLSAGYSFSSESQSTKKYVCGYLHKVSDSKWGKKRSWHRRWFVLDRQRGVLSYYRHNPAKHIPSSSSQGNIVHMADSPVPMDKGIASHRTDGHLFEFSTQLPAASRNLTKEVEYGGARRLSDSNADAKEAEDTAGSFTIMEESTGTGKQQEQDQTPEQQQTLLYLNEAHYWYRGALDLNMDGVSLLFEKTLARNAPTCYFFQVSTLALHDIDSKRGVQYKLCADTETDFDLWTSAIAEVINRKTSLNEKASTGAPMLSHQQRYRQLLIQKQIEEQAAREPDGVATADSGHEPPTLTRGRVSPKVLIEGEQKTHVSSNASSPSHPKRKIPPRIVTQFSSGSDSGLSDASCWHLHLHVDGTKQCLIVGFMLNIVAIRCLATEHVLWKVFVCITVTGLFVANIYSPRPGQRLQRLHRGSLGRSLTDLNIDKALHGTDVVECIDPDNCCLHKTSSLTGSDGDGNGGNNAEGVGDKLSRCSTTRRNVKFPMGSTMTRCERQTSGKSSNVEHSWTTTLGETFHIRSSDYKKSRKKEPSKPALFEFIGADLVRTESKVDLVSQRVEFPTEHENSRLFIINAQLPSYGPSVWGDGSYDGPGYTLALYWKIPNGVVEELKTPTTAPLTLLKRFLEAGNDTSLTDRFKIIAQVTNQDECGITGMAKKLLTSHNATPVLTRPQHRIYHFEDGTTEVVIDLHAFSYIARRGIHLLLDKTSRLVIDVAFVIQGEAEDELPEQVLGCCRLDHVNVQKAVDLL